MSYKRSETICGAIKIYLFCTSILGISRNSYARFEFSSQLKLYEKWGLIIVVGSTYKAMSKVGKL